MPFGALSLGRLRFHLDGSGATPAELYESLLNDTCRVVVRGKTRGGLVESVAAKGGSVVFVRLACDREAWLARVPDASRQAEGKLLDPDAVVGLFKGVDPFAEMPLGPTLTLDTTRLPPTETARQIVAHYGLPLVEAMPGARPT